MVSEVFGNCVADLLKVFARGLEVSWIFERCLEGIRNMSGSCMKGVWKVSGMGLEGIWEVS